MLLYGTEVWSSSSVCPSFYMSAVDQQKESLPVEDYSSTLDIVGDKPSDSPSDRGTIA